MSSIVTLLPVRHLNRRWLMNTQVNFTVPVVVEAILLQFDPSSFLLWLYFDAFKALFKASSTRSLFIASLFSFSTVEASTLNAIRLAFAYLDRVWKHVELTKCGEGNGTATTTWESVDHMKTLAQQWQACHSNDPEKSPVCFPICCEQGKRIVDNSSLENSGYGGRQICHICPIQSQKSGAKNRTPWDNKALVVRKDLSLTSCNFFAMRKQ